MLSLESQIEALLFFEGEPVKKEKLAKILKKDLAELEEALNRLAIRLDDHGLVLIFKDDFVSLGTDPEMSSLIETLKKEETDKDLSRAALETLSIILYKGPITRAEIDYIRGVNSSFILRNLLIRDLVEKEENPDDSRSYLYKPSINLLSFLGIASLNDLPEYQEVQKELEDVNKNKEVFQES